MLIRATIVTTALLFAGVLQAVLVFPLVRAIPIDFAQFYFAGQLVAQGQTAQLYDVEAYAPLEAAVHEQGKRVSLAHFFNRPAFAALLCYPLAFFSYQTSCNILVALNGMLWALLAWKLPPWLGAPNHLRLWLISFYPFAVSVALAQDTLLITLLVVYACVVLMPRHQAVAGALLALCLVKPHLVWLLPVLLILERKWTALRSFVITGTGLALLSFSMVGMTGVRQWLVLLSAPTTDVFAPSMGNLRALAINFGVPFATILGIISLGGAFTIGKYGSYKDRLSVLLVLALLVSPHTYWQDYSLVVVFALITPQPVIRYAILLPWAILWPTFDTWPLTLIVITGILTRAISLWRPVPAGPPTLSAQLHSR